MTDRGYVTHVPYKRKRGERINEKEKGCKKNITQEGGGLWRELIHGTTGSGNCCRTGCQKAGNYLGLVPVVVPLHNLQKDNFGIGSKSIAKITKTMCYYSIANG